MSQSFLVLFLSERRGPLTHLMEVMQGRRQQVILHERACVYLRCSFKEAAGGCQLTPDMKKCTAPHFYTSPKGSFDSLCPGMVLGSFFKSCHFTFMWTQIGCNRAAKIIALDWIPDQCVLSDSHGSFDTPGRWRPRLWVPSLPPLPLYAQPFSASHGVPGMVCPIWLCWGT